MTVYVIPHGAITQPAPGTADVTTHGQQYRPLSPMLLGPVPLYGGMWSRTMENAWQYAKVYRNHADDYWTWARAGWENPRAVRYPAGKGAKPLYSLWAGDPLDYITARKRIYLPLYTQAVRMHQLQLLLQLQADHMRHGLNDEDTIITDFDAYDHRALGYSWDDVVNDPDRKMGHGFVLAMMIEGVI